MAVKKRRGKWVHDYRDATGKRCRPSFDTREEAKEHERLYGPRDRRRTSPAVDPSISVYDYAQKFLRQKGPTLRPSSRAQYKSVVEIHLKNDVKCKMGALTRGDVKELIARKLEQTSRRGKPLSRETVRRIQATVRAICAWAVEDGLLKANPATGLGRVMGLTRTKRQRQEDMRKKAMTGPQLVAFLPTCDKHDPAIKPICLTMARAGLRIGEAIAARLSHVHFARNRLRVETAINSYDREEGETKSGVGRDVPLSPALRAFLRTHAASRREEALAKGITDPLLFPSAAETPFDHSNLEKRFKAVAKKAELPSHLTPHSLRHAYGSRLAANGVPPQLIQEWMGHGSIELTIGTYGSWFRKKVAAAHLAMIDDDTEQSDEEVDDGQSEAKAERMGTTGHRSPAGAV